MKGNTDLATPKGIQHLGRYRFLILGLLLLFLLIGLLLHSFYSRIFWGFFGVFLAYKMVT